MTGPGTTKACEVPAGWLVGWTTQFVIMPPDSRFRAFLMR